MMNRYLDSTGLSCDSPLFCQLSRTKCGYQPRSKGLSYSRLKELVLEAMVVMLALGCKSRIQVSLSVFMTKRHYF